MQDGRHLENRIQPDYGRTNAAVDPPCLKDCYARIKEIDAESREINERGFEDQPGQLQDLDKERQAIFDYLQCRVGKDGRPRELGTSPKQGASERVRKNLKKAYEVLEKELPDLASHLRKSIKRETGGFTYRPSQPIEWAF